MCRRNLIGLRRRLLSGLAAVTCLLPVPTFCLAGEVETSEIALIGGVDVHAHILVQKSHGDRQGLPPRGKPGDGRRSGRGNSTGMANRDSDSGYEEAGKHLVKKMAESGVAKVLLMPPPRTRDNTDIEEVDHLFELVRKYPKQVFVAAGGDVLNPMIQEVAPAKVTPQVRKQFEKTAEDLVGRGVKAFGEMTALHFSFNDKHVFEEVPPDHPLFLLLADLAAKHDIPIDLHMEAVQKKMQFPAGFDKRSRNNPSSLEPNIPALETLLAHNRKARIVWQHIGWDNTGDMTIELLTGLLRKHPNLFMALRLEDRPVTPAGTPMPNRLIDRDGNVKPEWLAFFREFPDRFMVGTDEFCSPEGASGIFGNKESPQSFKETWQFARGLPTELVELICRKNAERIYKM